MAHKFGEFFKKSLNDPRKRKSLQGSMGIAILSLFVLSSVIVNQSIQAANQSSSNYGYYGGTYGFNSSTTSSDAVPAAASSLSCSSSASTTGSCSWTAPTLTTTGTNIASGTPAGSISSYNVYYGTSSFSTCGGGASSTDSTSVSASLSSLTASTTYYVVVCALDNNLNEGSPASTSFTTASAGGGNAPGGGGGGSTGPTYPTGTTTTTTTTTGPASAANVTQIQSSATEFGVVLSPNELTTMASFVANGSNASSMALGSGERLALVRDQLETLGRVSLTALEQLANGQIPTVRNLTKEQGQLVKVLVMFERLMGHRPNFKNAKENLGWNTMMYRIRFKRDLVKERVGITKFRAVFGRTPTSPLDWSVVRAWGYSLR